MKKLFLALLFATSFMSCDKDLIQEDTMEATIVGRWQAVGFDDVIRYEFTEDKRYTIYGSDENGENPFPTLEEFMQQNPGLPGNDWVYDGEVVVIDLHFGNYSRLVPKFRCGNSVIDWISETGSLHSTYYREGFDISTCN